MGAAVDLRTVDAVLLDMDGTLVDSDAAVERAWTLGGRVRRRHPAPRSAIAHGSPADRTVRRVRPALDEADVARSWRTPGCSACSTTTSSTSYRRNGAGALLAALDRLALPWRGGDQRRRDSAKARLDAAGIACRRWSPSRTSAPASPTRRATRGRPSCWGWCACRLVVEDV